MTALVLIAMLQVPDTIVVRVPMQNQGPDTTVVEVNVQVDHQDAGPDTVQARLQAELAEALGAREPNDRWFKLGLLGLGGLFLYRYWAKGDQALVISTDPHDHHITIHLPDTPDDSPEEPEAEGDHPHGHKPGKGKGRGKGRGGGP